MQGERQAGREGGREGLTALHAIVLTSQDATFVPGQRSKVT